MSAPRPDWHHAGYPELREAPPWVTEEMVAAQPRLAPAMLAAALPGADALADRIGRTDGPVSVVGCGTSEHGAMAIAALLEATLGFGRATARPAFEAAIRPAPGGVCIGVSHDGGTRATVLALQAARDAGAVTALVTAAPGGAGAAAADVVVETPMHDDSWCHTVAYTSAILAGAALGRALGLPDVDAGQAEATLRGALGGPPPDIETIAGAGRLLAVGTGLDAITARELALKVAEGARIPAAMHELETLLHGHLAGEDAATAAVLVRTGGEERVRRRAALAEAALGELGIAVARIEPPPAAVLHPIVHRLLAGAVSLQRLTLALVAARGVNPDLIRREEAPWRAAAAAAEGAADW